MHTRVCFVVHRCQFYQHTGHVTNCTLSQIVSEKPLFFLVVMVNYLQKKPTMLWFFKTHTCINKIFLSSESTIACGTYGPAHVRTLAYVNVFVPIRVCFFA